MIDSMEIAEYAIKHYQALQKPWELAKFLDFISARDPKVVYEIGASRGGSLYAMATALPGKRTFVSIDLPNGPFGGSDISTGEIRELVTDANPHSTCIVIRGDSKVVNLPDEKPDLVFIDGDHTVQGVWADWTRYSPLVNRKGCVAFHDIVRHPSEANCEVDVIWEMLKLSEFFNTYEIIESNSEPWAGIGIIYV